MHTQNNRNIQREIAKGSDQLATPTANHESANIRHELLPHVHFFARRGYLFHAVGDMKTIRVMVNTVEAFFNRTEMKPHVATTPLQRTNLKRIPGRQIP
jgi:hypothetical protein